MEPTDGPLPASLQRGGVSYRRALWESENPSASVSFMIVQSKTSPARVLNVFLVKVGVGGRRNASELRLWGRGRGKCTQHHPSAKQGPCLQERETEASRLRVV